MEINLIMAGLVKYYSQLHRSDSPQEREFFLSNVQIPKISDEEKNRLNQLVAVKKVREAISQFMSSKTGIRILQKVCWDLSRH